MLAEDHVVVIVSAIPTTLAALAAFVVAIRNGRHIEASRVEMNSAHAETQATVVDASEKVVHAAEDAAHTAADVKIALEANGNGGHA